MATKQTQIAKPAAKKAAAVKPAGKTAATKAAAVKPAGKTAATKAAVKAAPKGAAKKTASVPQSGAKFFLRDGGGRPGSGRMLFAYTMAWLQETGLIDGGTIERDVAVKFAGATAITYHTTRTNWMQDKGGKISLSPTGANAFADRAHSDADREVYREILRTGKPDGKLIKNQTAIGTLQA